MLAYKIDLYLLYAGKNTIERLGKRPYFPAMVMSNAEQSLEPDSSCIQCPSKHEGNAMDQKVLAIEYRQ